MRRHFFGWDCSSDVELLTYVGVFENFSDEPSTVALFLRRRSEPDPLKVGMLEGLSTKNKTLSTILR